MHMSINSAGDMLSIKRKTTIAETRSKTSPTNPNNRPARGRGVLSLLQLHSSENQPQANKLQ
jgi:hypothetical protein